MGAELIDNTGRQRLLRAHHRQCYLFGSSPFTQGLDIGDIDVLQPGVERGAAVARCDVNRLHLGRLGEFPGQGVFTATAAHH